MSTKPDDALTYPFAFAGWSDLVKCTVSLLAGRVEASPEIKQEVATPTAGKATQLEKMRAIAYFLQQDTFAMSPSWS